MEDSKLHSEAPAGPVLELTAEIVAAYVSNNPVPAAELPALIAMVSDSINRLAGSSPAEMEKPIPAVPIKKSITNDYLISLEDGKKFKSLKRALATRYGLTPDEYRNKWGLPADYPMVAPGYSAARSQLAKQMGLGRKLGQKPPAPAKRGRKKAS
jgi:predicted transcriptional regulator